MHVTSLGPERILEMKRVLEKPWEYDVLEDEGSGRYFIEVVCGGVGTYTLRVPLTDEEAAEFLTDPRSVETLARKISQAPEEYRGRT